MYEIREQKKAIRDKYLTLRRAIDADTKKRYDNSICTRFMSLVTYRYADVLLLYSPLKDEIDINEIADNALSKNKIIAYPLCDEVHHTMTYHIVKNKNQLVKGAYGILQPTADLPLYDINNSTGNAVCFVPALVYDKDGYRLGYGKGFYDRYLISFRGIKVGFVYSDFILDRVPRGKFDTSVDVLVTEKGVRALHADKN